MKINKDSSQVSTSTGSVSHYYNLGIIVPRAYILGADEYYAMAGGDISLVCIIEDVSSTIVYRRALQYIQM